MGFFQKLLRKSTAVIFLTFLSLVLYLFVLLSCMTAGGGFSALYWVSVSQNATPGQGSHTPNDVRIGYFGLCINSADGKSYTCFSRAGAAHRTAWPLLLASISLQKNALYPLPALASVLFLLGIIYYFIAKRRGGRNERAAKVLLGISAGLGLAAALACMASARALEGASETFGGGTEIGRGERLSVLLWIAAAVHTLVVGYVACGMPGRGGGGSDGPAGA